MPSQKAEINPIDTGRLSQAGDSDGYTQKGVALTLGTTEPGVAILERSMATIPQDRADAIRTELLRLEEDCTHSGKSQFNAASRWGGYHYWVGVPSVVLSAIAGLAFVTDFPPVGTVLSAVVAILASLSTFLKPSERASAHKSAGDQYLALRNDSRVFREIGLAVAADSQSALDALQALNTRRNELNQASASPSVGDFNKARRGIKEGESTHLVDGGKL